MSKPVSAEQLAGSVERTHAHADGERVLADLRKRRKVVRLKLAASTHIGTTEAERLLYREERELEARISATAHELVPHRQAHGKRVEAALQPETTAAAAAALAAIAQAEVAIGRLNELREQLRLVGRAAPTLSPMPLKIVKLQLEEAVRKGEAA